MTFVKNIILTILVAGTSFSQAQNMLSDHEATAETQYLYRNLQRSLDKGYFVGHQDDLAYGVYWKYEEGRSDVKETVGDYPAVYGWELGDLELGKDKNLDGVPFDKMKEYIKEGYRRGGIITLSWHTNNPITGSNAWDFSNPSIKSIFPGGEHYATFISYLDKVADFMLDLKGDRGEQIPVLWRPWHEHTGTWFWWGVNSCSDEEYKELYRFSLEYLQNKGLHNLISVYNTGTEFSTPEEYLKRYPGDEYVDMLTFDSYQRGDISGGKKYAEQLDNWMKILTETALQQHKIPAIGEMGYDRIPDPNWFTEVVEPVLNRHRFSYVLFWRNAGFKPKEQVVEYYVPFPGHPAAEDFLQFYKEKKTLFEKEAKQLQLYKNQNLKREPLK